MGNCINLQPARSWVDDDDDAWECMKTKESLRRRRGKAEKARIRKEEEEEEGEGSSTLIKIKITKKQLEELLRRRDMQGIVLHKVVTQITSTSEMYRNSGARSWRPKLQTIPEVAE